MKYLALIALTVIAPHLFAEQAQQDSSSYGPATPSRSPESGQSLRSYSLTESEVKLVTALMGLTEQRFKSTIIGYQAATNLCRMSSQETVQGFFEVTFTCATFDKEVANCDLNDFSATVRYRIPLGAVVTEQNINQLIDVGSSTPAPFKSVRYYCSNLPSSTYRASPQPDGGRYDGGSSRRYESYNPPPARLHYYGGNVWIYR